MRGKRHMRIIACDDDRNMLQLIQQWTDEILKEQPHQFISYERGIDLLKEMEKYEGDEPQLVFMDINLKNDNGIGIAKELNKEYRNIAVIFISGYTEYFEDSFEADPIYFLIKPVKKDALEKAVDKALKRLSETKKKYLLVKGKEIRRIFYDDIYYAESEARKIKLYCENEIIEYYEKMDRLEQQLDTDFVRCHKSFLVNMKYIRCIDGKEITLLNGEKIPVSKKKSSETRDIIFEYLGRQL